MRASVVELGDFPLEMLHCAICNIALHFRQYYTRTGSLKLSRHIDKILDHGEESAQGQNLQDMGLKQKKYRGVVSG